MIMCLADDKEITESGLRNLKEYISEHIFRRHQVHISSCCILRQIPSLFSRISGTSDKRILPSCSGTADYLICSFSFLSRKKVCFFSVSLFGLFQTDIQIRSVIRSILCRPDWIKTVRKIDPPGCQPIPHVILRLSELPCRQHTEPPPGQGQ